MNLLADENIETEIVALLRDNGFNVDYVAEVSPSVDDYYIINKANKSNSVLVTSDKDFGELVFRQNLVNSGIILIRLNKYSPKDKAKIVVDFIKNHNEQLKNSFSVITPHNIRIRAKFDKLS